MVFPQGLLVGIGPGRITEIRTSSQSRGIYEESAESGNLFKLRQQFHDGQVEDPEVSAERGRMRPGPVTRSG